MSAEVDPPPEAEEEELLNFDMRRYLDGLKRYVWALLAIEALAITLAVIYTHRQPRVYQATASVQIEPRLPDLLGVRADAVTHANVDDGLDYYNEQKEVLGSYALVQETVKDKDNQLYLKVIDDAHRATMEPKDQIDLATRLVRDSLTIKYPDDNRIMYVVVTNTDPKLAAEIATDHVKTYVKHAKGLLSSDTKNASGVLTAEFDDAETKLRDAESLLFQFQKDNDLLAVTLEDRQNMVSSGITTYTTKLNETHAKRIELEAKLDRMRKAANEDVLSSPILVLGENTSFDALRAQYYAERDKFIELEKEIGPKNTAYQMQQAKVDDLYSALQSEAKRMLAGLEEQVQAIASTETALKAEVDRATQESLALGPKMVAYNELVRKKKSAEDRYNILRTKLSTSEMSYQMMDMGRNFDATNVRLLDEARVPSAPISPSLRKNVGIAAALALVVGFGLVFLVVFLDRSIKTTADAQQATGAPVLGVIPLLQESQLGGDERGRDLYVHQQPASSVAECCRSLRTNILFSSADRPLKTIVVSSANPREGKTTSALYLATTMAQSGQRVLLVDTDMRRPRLHISLGVPRQIGLSNLIVGEKSFDEVIKTTDIPNLWLLPCGPLPPNPAELLMSQRFAAVVEQFVQRFDRVIFDSPPLQLVTDAVVLSKQVDGVILVVHSDRTLREDAKRAARQIRHVGGVIFGTVVNALDDSRNTYYYGKYGAYYSYGEKSPEPQV